MPQGDKIIEELESLIEKRINGFTASMPAVQKQAYAEVLELTAQLEKYKDGTIKVSASNIRLIAKIKQRLLEVMIDGKYERELKKLVSTYEDITKLQNSYFATTVKDFTVPAVLAELQKQSIDITIESLGRAGIEVNVINPVRDILTKNITTGGKVSQFTEEIRAYLMNEGETEGRLVKYAKQITTDALNQYSRNYNKVISDDLGFVFWRYSGSLKETSREFCVKMIEAKNGCMKYFHTSQIPELLDGRICGEQIHINKKTGLPSGMMKGTNVANFYVNAGGFQCNHQIYGVATAVVPKELRQQFGVE